MYQWHEISLNFHFLGYLAFLLSYVLCLTITVSICICLVRFLFAISRSIESKCVNLTYLLTWHYWGQQLLAALICLSICRTFHIVLNGAHLPQGLWNFVFAGIRLTFSIMQNYFEVKKFALEAQDKNLAEAMIETAKTHKHTCKQHKYHASQVTQIHWTL